MRAVIQRADLEYVTDSGYSPDIKKARDFGSCLKAAMHAWHIGLAGAVIMDFSDESTTDRYNIRLPLGR